MQLEVESHTGRAVEHGRADFVPAANATKAADD